MDSTSIPTPAELFADMQTTVVGDGKFIDADTYRTNDGESIRILNYDAPEVYHPNAPDKPFEAGGSENTAQFARLAQERGFTEVYRSGRKDTYGRTLGDLMNPETGEMFSEFLIRNGMTTAQPSASRDAVDANVLANSRLINGGMNFDESLTEAFNKVWEANGEMSYKTNAIDESHFDPNLHSGVTFRHLDRTINNEALKPLSESFDSALIGMGAALQGARQMLGHVIGNEDMETAGQIGVAERQYELQRKPTMIVDWQDVNSIGDGVQYLLNNAAMSAPYMANTIASAAAGSAIGAGAGSVIPGLGTAAGGVIGFGVGLLSPTAIYAGQVYNAQDEKNWKVAMASGTAQAVLDRVGIHGASVAGKTMKQVLREAEETLVKRGLTRAAAKEQLAKATRTSMMELVDNADSIVRSQLGARNVTRAVLNGAAKGFGSEAVTEAAQEVLGYMGENWNEENLGLFDHGQFNAELINRLTNAAVAGGTLGGAFGAGSGLREVGAWADVAWDRAPANYSFDDTLANLEDPNKTLEEEMYDMERGDPDTRDIAFRVNKDIEDRAKLSPTEKAMESIKNAPVLWRGMVRARMAKDDLVRSHNLRTLGAVFGSNLGRIRSGKNYEDSMHLTTVDHLNRIGNPQLWFQGMGKTDKESKKQFNSIIGRFDKDYNEWFEQNSKNGQFKDGVSNEDYDWSKWDQYASKGFNESLSKDPTKNMVRQFFEAREAAAINMRNRQNAWWARNAKTGTDETGRQYREVMDPKFKKLNNYLGKYKKMKRDEVGRRRGDFEALLRSEYGFSKDVANDLTNQILDGQPLDGHSDNVFDLITKGVPATSAKKRTMGLASNPKFTEFFEQDVFENIHEAARNAARFETYHKYVGRDNWRVAHLLNEAGKEGVSQESLNSIARMIQNYLEAQSGNYKRPPKGSYGERALGVQRFALTWSLLTSLPLSAFSSIVELALLTQGLTKAQIFGNIHNLAYEFAMGTGKYMSRFSRDMWTGQELLPQSPHMKRVQYLGYMSWEAGAASTVGVSETSDASKFWIDRFFKYNGLEDLTNTERAMRLALMDDFVNSHVETIKTMDPKSEGYRFAYEQMRNLGLPVDRYIELRDQQNYTLQEKEELDRMQMLAEYTYINQAINLPGTSNRPLFYQDPRLALFTQFNGYVSTFTATTLPRLWTEYVKRGRPSMKYNTFAMMAMMVFLGFASQYLKDWLKYGEPSPYLNDQEKLRRAINSSGLLGQGERVLNFVWPTFESKSDTLVGKAADMALDEMPAMSPVRRLMKAGDALYQGDTDTAKYNALRGVPIMGPFTGLAERMSGLDFSQFQSN